MASAFGHAASAIGLGKLFSKNSRSLKVFILGVISAIFPDVDVIAYKFGMDGLDLFGHRGFTHSFFFAMLWAFLLLCVFHKKQPKLDKIRLGFFYFIAMSTHGLLDAMTTGGNGIAFFAPFSAERYFFPWRFIQVSPLGIRNFFTEWGIKVIKSEFLYIGIPSLILALIGNWINRNK